MWRDGHLRDADVAALGDLVRGEDLHDVVVRGGGGAEEEEQGQEQERSTVALHPVYCRSMMNNEANTVTPCSLLEICRCLPYKTYGGKYTIR